MPETARPASFRPVLDLAALLNEAQLRAATTIDGPLLVLAGAGSGKTRVLVHRIAHILEQRRARPWQLLSVTFTNKAAGEMRARLESLIGPEIRDAWIGTFHSVCGRLLRRHADVLGFTSSFTIYDTDDSKRVIKRVLSDLEIATTSGITPAGVAGEIDRAKNKGLGPKALLEQDAGFLTPVQRAARRVYPKYQEALRSSNAMDFGDLLLLAAELLRHHPDLRSRYVERFRYVMVDEFQDTNAVQYELLELLTRERRNLMVVGDDDQSIYRWRGAEVKNILDFPRRFPGATVVKLERNYRSSANVLAAANAVIARNQTRHPKTLYTEAGDGAPIGVALLPHGDDEAIAIARIVAARVRAGESPDRFAILYRQNAQSRPFELALRRERVPFTLIGATGFFERKEVKDVLSYLRVLANPASTEDFERIANVPGRKLGPKALDRLRAAASAAGVSGAQAVELPKAKLEAAGLKGAALKECLALGALLSRLRSLAEEGTATEVAKAVIERTGYRRWLELSDPSSAEERIANVEELVTSISEHETLESILEAPEPEDPDAPGVELGLTGARTPLAAYLDQVSLTSPNDKKTESGAVSMLTLHAAKGLEFPIVFMVGMEEHTFPSRRAVDGDQEQIEEERRLCYVGMTRAMEELHLTGVRYRRIYGAEEVRRPSRFLGELPERVVSELPLPAGIGAGYEALYRTSGARYATGAVDPFDLDPLDDDPFVDPPEPPTDFGVAARGGFAAPPRSPRRPWGRSAPAAVVDDVDGGWSPEGRAEPAEPDTPGGWRPGALVEHNTFGQGRVLEVDGHGPRAHLTIEFPGVGRKRVVARYVAPTSDRARGQT